MKNFLFNSALLCILVCSINFINAQQTVSTATVTGQPVTATITTQPQTQNKCLGSNVTFTVAATGTAPVSYQWIKDGFIISGATNATYTIPSVTLASQGMYTCQVTNLCRSITSNQAELKVVNLTINAGSDATFCNDTSVQLNANIFTNYPSLSQPYTSIVWSPSTGLSATNIVNPVAQPTSNTTYTVTLTDALGCTATDAITLTSNTPVSITAQPLSYNKCLNNNVTFTINTSGTAPITYIWKKGGTPITGATSNTYTINGLGLSDEAIYICEPTNYCRTLISDNAELKVIQLLANAGTDTRICNGQGTTLSASASSNHPAESGNYSYSWSPATGLSASNIYNPNAAPTVTTDYTVQATDQIGCTATDVVNVLVQNVFQNEEICLVTVDSTSTKNLIIWEKPLATNISSFNIYREISSVYTFIANVPYSAQSIFTDNTNGVNPNITSYKYKISVVDTCGNESVLSSEHRTIHVSISPATPCGYNLIWNDYFGLSVTQYLIYRDSSNTGWVKIDSVSFGNTLWTDPTCFSVNDTIAYLVEVINPAGCTPTKAVTHNSTRSNVQKNFAISAPLLSDNDLNLKIYPNPTNGKFTVQFTDSKISFINSQISITNALGENVYSLTANNKSSIINNQLIIDLFDQPSGIYIICIKFGEKVEHQKLLKE